MLYKTITKQMYISRQKFNVNNIKRNVNYCRLIQQTAMHWRNVQFLRVDKSSNLTLCYTREHVKPDTSVVYIADEEGVSNLDCNLHKPYV